MPTLKTVFNTFFLLFTSRTGQDFLSCLYHLLVLLRIQFFVWQQLRLKDPFDILGIPIFPRMCLNRTTLASCCDSMLLDFGFFFIFLWLWLCLTYTLTSTAAAAAAAAAAADFASVATVNAATISLSCI
jgi:hypothetical protein